MKIILIRPNMGDYRSTDAMPPLAMGILAARSTGHQVRFFDDKTESIPANLEADLVALSVETFTARRAYQLADGYRQRGIPVVMGGYHPTFLPDESLLHADAVVSGDAEGAWESLLDDLSHGRLRRIYRGDNRAPLDGTRIDRSIFAGKRYAPIEVAQYGRGCRFVCEFCSIHQFYGSQVRTRPAEQFRAELESLDNRRLLFLVDDNLLSARADLDSLLDVLAPLRRRWACQISIDAASDPVLLDRLAEAGCCYVLIGFESLEAENLRQMHKPWNRVSGEYRKVVRELHARGIGVYGTFVFGYDHDTPDTIRRSLDFALEARLEIANFNPLTPTPGSGLYARLEAEGRLITPRWWLDPAYRYGDPIFAPRLISPKQLVEDCFEAKRAFYAWAAIARRVLDNDIRFSWHSRTTTTVANLISRREVYRKQGRHLGA
jgi:radical SAM superfamily enzyme YgiQ (UPF0313 family)